ncbi:squamosa promoter-binding-like protein 13A [Tanacetum coccineum]
MLQHLPGLQPLELHICIINSKQSHELWEEMYYMVGVNRNTEYVVRRWYRLLSYADHFTPSGSSSYNISGQQPGIKGNFSVDLKLGQVIDSRNEFRDSLNLKAYVVIPMDLYIRFSHRLCSNSDIFRSFSTTIEFDWASHIQTSIPQDHMTCDDSVQHNTIVKGDRLKEVRDYIDDTEDYVNIELDNQRNDLIQLQLTLTIASFAIAFENDTRIAVREAAKEMAGSGLFGLITRTTNLSIALSYTKYFS